MASQPSRWRPVVAVLVGGAVLAAGGCVSGQLQALPSSSATTGRTAAQRAVLVVRRRFETTSASRWLTVGPQMASLVSWRSIDSQRALAEELREVGRRVGVACYPVAVDAQLEPLAHRFGDRGERDEVQQALISVVAASYLLGVSTRRAGKLAKTRGSRACPRGRSATWPTSETVTGDLRQSMCRPAAERTACRFRAP